MALFTMFYNILHIIGVLPFLKYVVRIVALPNLIWALASYIKTWCCFPSLFKISTELASCPIFLQTHEKGVYTEPHRGTSCKILYLSLPVCLSIPFIGKVNNEKDFFLIFAQGQICFLNIFRVRCEGPTDRLAPLLPSESSFTYQYLDTFNILSFSFKD